MDKKFFTTFEVGELCQVYHTTVINWINKGQLKATLTPGRHRRIQKEDLLAFMKGFNIHIPEELTSPPKEKILVVDDEESVLRFVRRTLEKKDPSADIQTTTSGIAALVMIGQNPPDLVVLDVVMPGMDGIEVCKTLKSNSDTKGIKILVMTGAHLSEGQKSFLKRHVDGLIFKPFSVQELETGVRNSLSKKRRVAI